MMLFEYIVKIDIKYHQLSLFIIMPFDIQYCNSIVCVHDKLLDLAKTYNKILLLCDIDNTVLKMPRFLGSDEWFRWQVELMASNANFNQGRIAVDIDHLRHILDILYKCTIPLPFEGKLTMDFVSWLKQEETKQKLQLVFVTARNETARESTQMHLREALGLTYMDDYELIMCTGRNKGDMILDYFTKENLNKYDNIMFIDDCFKNISNVALSFKDMSNHISCIFLGVPENNTQLNDNQNDWPHICPQLEPFMWHELLSPFDKYQNS